MMPKATTWTLQETYSLTIPRSLLTRTVQSTSVQKAAKEAV